MTEASPSQQITTEWLLQRTQFSNDAEFQSSAWIAPATLETFRDQNVLECGCGGGDHTSLVAAIARTVTAVDLNTATLARNRMKDFTNVEFVEAELISMNLGQ